MLALSCPVDGRWGANADECHKKLQKENSQKAFPCSSPKATRKQAVWSGKNHPVAHPCTNHRLKENMKLLGHDWAKYNRKGELFPESRKIFSLVGSIFIGLKTCGYLWETWVSVMIRRCQHPSTIKRHVNIMTSVCVQPFCWTLLMSTSQSWLAFLNHGKQDTETGNYMKR